MCPQQWDPIFNKKIECFRTNFNVCAIFEPLAIRESDCDQLYFLEPWLREVLLNCNSRPLANTRKNDDGLYVARNCSLECYSQTVFKILLPFMEEVLDYAVV